MIEAMGIGSWIAKEQLESKLREARTGNYFKISKAFSEIVSSMVNLKECQPADLESIYGIGPKTARFFIIWTRPNARVAALDVHILRWLSARGYNAPRQTPTGKKYAELETIFLAEADKRDLTPQRLDEIIWKTGSNYDQQKSFDSVSSLVGATNGN